MFLEVEDELENRMENKWEKEEFCKLIVVELIILVSGFGGGEKFSIDDIDYKSLIIWI